MLSMGWSEAKAWAEVKQEHMLCEQLHIELSAISFHARHIIIVDLGTILRCADLGHPGK